ncbi:sensor domain-containing protein [Thiobacillus sedimenti]|uniref:EAL domain-containing protein n=1 Tax=Thiobacillus sedimenti TaxID=3110231 RepID=A0ABZ1CGT5_9PROT|nr:EAL domain-containing protein [Thiobacillus sp. SCUT-2]WRS38578.1 EAL domain-containing protein [Thiobacillus sp. SCUT-2]
MAGSTPNERTSSEAEARYRALFDSMDEAVAVNEAVFDAHGELVDCIVLDVNPAFEVHAPYQAAETVGQRVTRLGWVSPERLRSWGRAHVSAAQPARFEYFHKPSGRWFSVLVTPIVDGRFFTIFSNVTERKRVEADLLDSETLLSSLIATMSEGVVMEDADARILACNPAAERILGLTAEQIMGRSSFDPRWRAVHEDGTPFRGEDHPTVTTLRTGEPQHDVTMGVHKPDGNLTWISTNSQPIYHPGDDGLKGVVASFHDITARKRVEEELRRKQAMLARTENIAHIGSWEWHVDTDTVTWSDELFRIFQLAPGDGAPSFAEQSRLYHPEDTERLRALVDDAVRSGTPYEIELRVIRKDGEMRVCLARAVAEMGPDGRARYLVGSLQDITERKRSEEAIHQLAFYDPLTGLPNRRMLQDRLHTAIVDSARSGRFGALLMLDLDHFKTINDTGGHPLGDHLLQDVAHRLRRGLREGDAVARLGGDEFVVILEELGGQSEEAAIQARTIAEKIRLDLSQPYSLQGKECHSTVSIGISLFQAGSENIQDLLQQGDLALYKAKAAGRNTTSFYEPAMQAALEQRFSLEADLRQALKLHQLQLYHQIQVDVTGRPFGAEALLRWQHPERGFVTPDHFIPLAEESGLILPIGLWVLETACAQLKAWAGNPATCDLTLAVNVSARQFRQADFVAAVESIIQASGACPSRLKLELTESVAMDDFEDSVTKMNALRLLGVHFSMDDFGTGHSSLSNLKRLPLSQVKIDRSFVRDIASDPNDAAIVNTIIAMGRTMGLQVIAEGVETEEQQDFLRRHHCDAFQGYLIGRPVPADELEKQIDAFARR